jgi:hypothetical protein
MFFGGLQRVAAALAVSGTLSAALRMDQGNPTAIHDITHEKINLNGFNMRVLCLRYWPRQLMMSRLSPGPAERRKVQGYNLPRKSMNITYHQAYNR